MDSELLDIVDENDNVIGRDTKANKLRKGLISRNIAIFIIDKDGKMLVSKRASTKKSFPNLYDPSAAGNVRAGESYEDAAKRELGEELGAECGLETIGTIHNDFTENGGRLRYITAVFLGRYSGQITPNAEIAEIKRRNTAEIDAMIAQNPAQFTPGFLKEFPLVRNKLVKGEIQS